MSTCRTDAQIAAARARIAAAGLQTNPIGENLLKFYPTDPTGKQHVNGANVANMNTFSVKIDHQLEREQPDQRARLLRQQLPVGAGRQQRRDRAAASADRLDMFNIVISRSDDGALVGVVWNSTLSTRTLLETRIGLHNDSARRSIRRTTRSIPKSLGHQHGAARCRRNSAFPPCITAFRLHRRRRRLSDFDESHVDVERVLVAHAHTRRSTR